jgi:hypothetical protein
MTVRVDRRLGARPVYRSTDFLAPDPFMTLEDEKERIIVASARDCSASDNMLVITADVARSLSFAPRQSEPASHVSLGV